jgi:hypothetical protein
MRAIRFTTLNRTVLLCGAVLFVAACTAPPPGGGGGGPVVPAPPDGDTTRFRQVVPEGDGCDGRSANTRVSSDGLVFTTTFSTYDVRVNPGQTEAAKGCNFTIRLHTPSGRSVSLQSLYYSTYAYLTPGVRGYLQTAYWFEGTPVAPRSAAHAPLVGPGDGEVMYTDDVPINDTVWTPCGADRVLHVATKITLQSGSAEGSGYMNLSSLDGSSKVEARVDSRPCP